MSGVHTSHSAKLMLALPRSRAALFRVYRRERRQSDIAGVGEGSGESSPTSLTANQVREVLSPNSRWSSGLSRSYEWEVVTDDGLPVPADPERSQGSTLKTFRERVAGNNLADIPQRSAIILFTPDQATQEAWAVSRDEVFRAPFRGFHESFSIVP